MSQVDDVISEVETLIKDYEDIAAFYSPSTLKEAVQNAWEGSDKITHLLVNLLPYKEKAADKQRLISMKQAMAVLRDMEEQLVGSLIPTWDDLLFDQLFGLYQTVLQTLVAIVQYWDANQARSIIVKCWKIINKAYEMSAMVGVATTVFAIEQRYELRIANGKMKQKKHAKRMRVKKIART